MGRREVRRIIDGGGDFVCVFLNAWLFTWMSKHHIYAHSNTTIYYMYYDMIAPGTLNNITIAKFILHIINTTNIICY
jgi:hypothetical protein